MWGADQVRAFKTLKDRLASAPVLVLPDDKTPLHRDDGRVGHGDRGSFDAGPRAWTPTREYMSRVLKPSERNWHTYDKELWAMVSALKTWRHYLDGPKFELHTDHQTFNIWQIRRGGRTPDTVGGNSLRHSALPCVTARASTMVRRMGCRVARRQGAPVPSDDEENVVGRRPGVDGLRSMVRQRRPGVQAEIPRSRGVGPGGEDAGGESASR